MGESYGTENKIRYIHTYVMSVYLEVTFTVRKIRLLLVGITESRLVGKNLVSNFKI